MKMKKILTDIRTMAAVLMASATLAACSSDDNIIEEQPVQPTGPSYCTLAAIRATTNTSTAWPSRGKTKTVAPR